MSFRLPFFFNDTATTEIYTLSLHDALPIFDGRRLRRAGLPDRRDRDLARHRPRARAPGRGAQRPPAAPPEGGRGRSEEHTSELQSRQYLVCRLLLEKKKITRISIMSSSVLE